MSSRIGEIGSRPDVLLPLAHWCDVAQIHETLSDDILERFGSVPETDAHSIEVVVNRIQQCGKHCIAPCVKVTAFGSSVNGYGEASSDVDLLLAVDERDLFFFHELRRFSQVVFR